MEGKNSDQKFIDYVFYQTDNQELLHFFNRINYLIENNKIDVH
jgi:hypothetical protein